MYEYRVTLVKVIDGDTIDVDIDLGFFITVRQRCRLKGVNAPEPRGETREAGLAATEFARKWLEQAGPLRIQSSKPYPDDKYGRFLVTVFSGDQAMVTDPADPRLYSLNERLITHGHAVPYPA